MTKFVWLEADPGTGQAPKRAWPPAVDMPPQAPLCRRT